MASFIASLRTVTVGGTVALSMTSLRAVGEAASLQSVRTYIASGNVVFGSEVAEWQVKAVLEEGLLVPRWQNGWRRHKDGDRDCGGVSVPTASAAGYRSNKMNGFSRLSLDLVQGSAPA